MNCRACSQEIKKPFFSLGKQPLSNAYIKKENINKTEPVYPLDCFVCPKCFLVQIDEFERAENIFNEEYAYFSSFSDSWLKHCEAYVNKMTERWKLGSKNLVIEIASNDGYLLQFFKKKGVPVLGIEPTANTAEEARKQGIPTEVVFFNTETAGRLKKEGRQADLLLGNNVLAHVPPLNDFVAGLKLALKPTGVITMEFPHLEKMIEGNQFDTIYHEHFCYLSLTTVQTLFFKHGLTIFDVDELPTHGGSLRIYARHNENDSLKISAKVSEITRREERKGFLNVDFYNSFAAQAEKVRSDVLKFLKEAKAQGKKVCGYGAPAKGNTLLNFCDVKSDLLLFTVDKNPWKQGRYLPGSHIPVFAPEKIREARPDYVFILPWNIRDEVIDQMAYIREWGGRFAVPIPQLEII